MKTYKLHFIRHGLTQANFDGTYCGTTDIPLCDEGRNQLMDLCVQNSYPYVDVVYSSPLLRARETAELLFPGCEYIAVENLREASFGPFEGMTIQQLNENEDARKWLTPGSNYTPVGVEPADAFYTRCRDGVIQIVEDMMRNGITSAAVVTHAGVIGAAMAALAYPQLSPYDWNCEAGHGFTLRADPSLFMRDPVLEYVCDIPSENGSEIDEDFYETE